MYFKTIYSVEHLKNALCVELILITDKNSHFIMKLYYIYCIQCVIIYLI